MAEERGIELVEVKEARLGGLHRAGHGPDRVRGRGGRGRRHRRRAAQRPYLVGVWGESFYMPFADHLAIFRYADQPGMIGRVGTVFGEQGVNIVSAAVGAEESGDEAVMALTTDAPVPDEVVARDPRARRLRRRPGRRL